MKKNIAQNRVAGLRRAVIIGIILSLIAIGYAMTLDEHYNELKSRCTASAQAELVDTEQKTVKARREIASHQEYRGVYSFKTENGTKYQARSGWSTSENENKSAAVMYDPKNPSVNYIEGQLRRAGFIGYIAAAVLLAMTVSMMLRIKKLGGTIIPNLSDVPSGEENDMRGR